MNSKKIAPSQVNNADDRQESGKSKGAHAKERSEEEYKNEPYCLYYPLDSNRKCKICNESLGIKIKDVENHLSSHNIVEYEYKCVVCEKSWPSWRSVTMHYSKST